MNLYQLTQQYLELVSLSDHLDEEVLQDTLEAIQEPMEMKLANMALVIRSIESEIDAITKEEKRMSELKKSKQATIARLKETIQNNVELIGEETKTGSRVLKVKDNPYLKSLSVQNNPPSVNVLDVSKIPGEFFVAVEPKVDSKSILEALKAGETIDGVEIIRKRGVRIK